MVVYEFHCHLIRVFLDDGGEKNSEKKTNFKLSVTSYMVLKKWLKRMVNLMYTSNRGNLFG